MKANEFIKATKDVLDILDDKTFQNFRDKEHEEDKEKSLNNNTRKNYFVYRQNFLKKNLEKKISLIKEGICGTLKDHREINKKIDDYLQAEKYNELKMLVESVLKKIEIFNDIDAFEIGKEMSSFKEKEKNNKKQTITFKLPKKLPDAIKDEVIADIEEIKKCFENECYRSCVIICGRLLEVALHRKYFEVTNNDILETNPGIGLGSLVAKLHEKKVELEPGLNEQIHLINQVRIHSVHKKSKVFVPSKEKTQAIILFSMDVLNKIFS